MYKAREALDEYPIPLQDLFVSKKKERSYRQSTKLVSFDIQMDDLKYEIVQNALNVTFDTGFYYSFVNPRMQWSQKVPGVLKVSWLKNWNPTCKAIYFTWKSMIAKYKKNPLFCYKVVPIAKYFPIILKIQGSTVSVNNYHGLKKQWLLKFKNFEQLKLIEGNVISYKSYDDILSGSLLDQFKALRYKVKLNKKDRRIFTDGFKISKSVEYKA